VYGISRFQIINFSLTTAAGGFILLFILLAVIKKPSKQKIFFTCFFAIGLFHLAGVFVSLILRNRPGSFALQDYWLFSQAVSRLRYLFLILFIHSFYRFRLRGVLTVIMFLFIGAGIFAPFVVYSLIPSLVEILLVLYTFFYLLLLYKMRNRLSLSSHQEKLLKTVLLCTAFFLVGILLDILEGIPQVSVYISLLLIDFYPIYMVSIGGLFLHWAYRDLRFSEADDAGQNQSRKQYDISVWPVTAREGEIIELILAGNTNAFIAENLFIAESTVKKHINNIFKKLKISSRWELLKLIGENTPEVLYRSSPSEDKST